MCEARCGKQAATPWQAPQMLDGFPTDPAELEHIVDRAGILQVR